MDRTNIFASVAGTALLIIALPCAAGVPDIDGISGSSYEMPPPVPRDETTVRAEILDWLTKHWLMTLATTEEDGQPHVSGVVYYNREFTVYFASKRESNKIRNIQRDPRVAYTVWDPVDRITELKALQVRGRARILEGEERETAARRFSGAPFDVDYAVVEIKPLIVRWTDRSRAADYTDVLRFSEE